MNRQDCLGLLAPKITEELVITNLGGVAREWYRLKERDGNLYQAYLGHATALGLGLALALPHRKVVSLDGDGSMLFDLTILPAIAEQSPANFIVIVLDNEAYEAPGGLPTFTAGATDLSGMAREAGIQNTMTVRQLSEFQEAIDEAFDTKQTSFITAKVELSTQRIPYTSMMGIENRFRFIRHIEKTENIQVIQPPTKVLPQDKMIRGI